MLITVKRLYWALRGNSETRSKNRRWRPRHLLSDVQWYEEMLGKSGWNGAAVAEDPGTALISDNALSMRLANGSRIISLPGTEETIRGYGDIALLILDEAARVPDHLYLSVRPFLAASKGQLVALSTPFGKRGWFWEEWQHVEEDIKWNRKPSWEAIKVKAEECPRLTPAFLAREHQSMGDRWYGQEYRVEFRDTIDAVFSHDMVEKAGSELPTNSWF